MGLFGHRHKMAVRHKLLTETGEWAKQRDGVKIKGSDWIKKTYIVIKECSCEGCNHRIAYKMFTKSTEAEDVEHIIEDIHPDLADELLFVDKI